MEVSICVGSSCHLKGAPAVVEAFRRSGQQVVKLTLGASFCQGRCTEGVIVSINNTIYTRVKPVDVPLLLAIHQEGGTGDGGNNHNQTG